MFLKKKRKIKGGGGKNKIKIRRDVNSFGFGEHLRRITNIFHQSVELPLFSSCDTLLSFLFLFFLKK